MRRPPVVIEQTEINGFTVSTIQYWHGEYETMVFDWYGDSLESYTHGTFDQDEALDYNRSLVKKFGV